MQLRRLQSQLFEDVEGLKSLVESLIELKQDFINTNIHRAVFLSLARWAAARGFEAFRSRAGVGYGVPFVEAHR